MRVRHLQTRFLLAGVLVLLAAVISGAWSVYTLAHLSAVVDDTLRGSQETIDLSAALAGSLEREDDALLLAVGGDPQRARRELDLERQRGDEFYRRLLDVLATGDTSERQIVDRLRGEIDRYRAAGDKLLDAGGPSTALERYHLRVNPLLRQAVTSCGKLREENFRSMKDAGVRARDEAHRATWLVSGVTALAVVVALLVSVGLARAVLRPVRPLAVGVESLRRGDFDRRVPISTVDELGQLAGGFNRMAEALAEYRQSSLGELLAIKSTLEATVNALPDAVLVIAPDGAIMALNPPARAILAAKRVADAGSIRALPLSSSQRDAIETALTGRLTVAPRTDFNQTLAVLLKDRPHRFLLTAVPIQDFTPGRFGAVVVLDDVTEFARLDELRSELVGVASHELKTPLTTLRMNLLMLGEEADTLTSRQRELLGAALGGCEELGGTIEELLDVTRIEAGQLRLNTTPVDILAVIEQVRCGLQARFDDARVTVQLLRDTPKTVVQADAARLAVVLGILLSNALKYSSPGSTVKVQLVSRQNAGVAAGRTMQIAVTDQGPGVPAEFRERVFDKFFRVEHQVGSHGNGVHGTGIGLYLCREIVKAHGGTITCESGDGGLGTRIAISLPASL
jgi:NtrC-family two-component system sensor histidine kinase KinB